jgi:hypothetical protein
MTTSSNIGTLLSRFKVASAQYDAIIGKKLNINIKSTTDKSYEYSSYEETTLKNIGEMIKVKE